jgi:hypothetical protein
MADASDKDTNQPPTGEPPQPGPRRLRPSRRVRRRPKDPDGDLVDKYDDKGLSGRAWQGG